MKKLSTTLQLAFWSFFLAGLGIMNPTWLMIDSVDGGTSEAWGIDVDSNDDIYWVVSNDLRNQGLDIVCRKFEQGGNEIWETPLLLRWSWNTTCLCL